VLALTAVLIALSYWHAKSFSVTPLHNTALMPRFTLLGTSSRVSDTLMNTSPINEGASKKTLQATAIAIAVALVLLFTAVLPAEYGSIRSYWQAWD